MKVFYDAPWPMTAAELIALDKLMDIGKVHDGEHVTPERLADLVGCDHPVRPIDGVGKYACANCLGAN